MSCRSFPLILPKSNLSSTMFLGLRIIKVIWCFILCIATADILLKIICAIEASNPLSLWYAEAVFAQTKPIVASVLDGYNVCIFAYGQTGTGKTFTMEGSPENRGVNYRTLDELFRVSQERSGIMRYGLFVSMMEVYNEKIRDLLIDSSNQPPKKLVSSFIATVLIW